MKLSDLLESKFRGDIRFRGAAYVHAERAAITRVETDRVVATVRDGSEYQITLTRKGASLQMRCTCRQGSGNEATCKHVWATILLVDQEGYLNGSPKIGYFPPFLPDPEPDELDDWDDDFADGPGFPDRRERLTKPTVRRQLSDWEVRLGELQERIHAGWATPASASRERRVIYEIDVESCWSTHQLVLGLWQQQQLSRGDWGKRKPLRVRPGQRIDVSDAEDCQILAKLIGSVPERSPTTSRSSDTMPLSHRFRVPFELCELLLPDICETGRLQVAGGVNSSHRPVEWNGTKPWSFSLHVIHDESESTWCVEGRFNREDEEITVRDAQLIVPGGLVLHDNRLSPCTGIEAFEWIELLRQETPLKVNDGEEEELIDRLLAIPSRPKLTLPEALRLEEVTVAPVPYVLLHAPRGAGWRRQRLQGEVQFDYQGIKVAGSSQFAAIIQRQERKYLVRDAAREQAAWSQLEEHGFRLLPDRHRTQRDVEIHARDLGPAVRGLLVDGWQVRADGHQVWQPNAVKLRVQTGIDWFELHGDVSFEGRSIAFPELLAAVTRGDTTVRLDDGSLGILPEEWAQRYGMLAGMGVVDDDHLRFQSNQLGFLDALLAVQDSVDYDDRFNELRESLASLDGLKPLSEPDAFCGELRGYQREGMGWLQFLKDTRLGGCLADDMGLGKTIQVLALLQARQSENENGRKTSLIVVPKSLIFNWQEECRRFTPRLKPLEYVGIDRASLRPQFNQHDIILTTYGTLRRDILELKNIPFDYVVLDEAQMIKNAGSQVAKASRLLKANHRLALTGTPIENHIGDLWSIFEFLNPGMLGRSAAFRSFSSDDAASRQILARGLRPFILRRTKQQVASELPEKVEQTIHCQMGNEQRRLYKQMRDHYRDSLLGVVRKQGLAQSKLHVLEALLRLRQAACHPALLDETRLDESSAKLDVLCTDLEELLQEGHKALVFSQFTSMLSIVRHHLDQRGIEYAYLDGQTNDRRSVVKQFQTDPQCGVFLISLRAGGFGLNLTAADYVFLLDPWWNPAVETQAIDRAHRVGQTRRVVAYRLICSGTVEEKILELQGKKRELADAILQESDSLLKRLSMEDLELLLS